MNLQSLDTAKAFPSEYRKFFSFMQIDRNVDCSRIAGIAEKPVQIYRKEFKFLKFTKIVAGM